jgi:hypothetical protein
MSFQIFDMVTDRGLREVYSISSLGKAFELDDLAENIKLP